MGLGAQQALGTDAKSDVSMQKPSEASEAPQPQPTLSEVIDAAKQEAKLARLQEELLDIDGDQVMAGDKLSMLVGRYFVEDVPKAEWEEVSGGA